MDGFKKFKKKKPYFVTQNRSGMTWIYIISLVCPWECPHIDSLGVLRDFSGIPSSNQHDWFYMSCMGISFKRYEAHGIITRQVIPPEWL